MFKIRSLKVGELYLPHEGGIMRDPIYCWLVTNDETTILVDSGMPDIEVIRKTLRVDGCGGGHQSLIDALGEENLSPGDIDYITPTHLHFDHASNLELFPDACVVLQRDELLHAVDPTPTQRIYFTKETLTELIGRKRPKQLRIIDGDLDLMDGFFLLKAPAHTPGFQVPIVQTTKGKAALVSDLGDHYKYWFPADPRATDRPKRFLSDTFLPGPIRSESERDWNAAMALVLKHADIVIPAHDSRIPKRMPEEWFAIPESTDGDIGKIPFDRQSAPTS